jgi:hypothetical protein
MKAAVFPATEQIDAEQGCCRKWSRGSVDDGMTAMTASAERDSVLKSTHVYPSKIDVHDYDTILAPAHHVK